MTFASKYLPLSFYSSVRDNDDPLFWTAGAVRLNHSPVLLSLRRGRHGRMQCLSQQQHFAYGFPYIPFMLGGGHFDLFSRLTLNSKQSQPRLRSGRILSLSPFVEDEEMAIK